MTAYQLDPRSRRRLSRIAPAVVATLLLLLVLAAFFLAPPASGAERAPDGRHVSASAPAAGQDDAPCPEV